MMEVDWSCWLAPAKLNLMLHITGQRIDGYHQLQTLFQILDKGDEICFKPRNDSVISLDAPGDMIPEADNLIFKAAKLLQQQTGYPSGIDIKLKKILPMGAGLGGGSSDAATTLVALNRIWDLSLDIDKLASIGLSLGADVPVFVRGNSAWAQGVGENLQPVKLPESWYVIVFPGISVSTATVFQHPELTRNSSAIKIPAVLLSTNIDTHFYMQYRNDCESLVRKLVPEVDAALKWLDTYAPARMTGTGSSVFAAFESESQAYKVLEQLPEKWWGMASRGLNHSPSVAIEK